MSKCDVIDITIEEFVDILNNHLEKNTLKNFDFEKYNVINIESKINFKKNTYTRNILFECELYEIILICWSPNSKTPIHKHPKNGCLLKVINGNLIEELYQKDKIINSILLKNDIKYLDDSIGTHKIISEDFCVSLHIYSPSGFYK